MTSINTLKHDTLNYYLIKELSEEVSELREKIKRLEQKIRDNEVSMFFGPTKSGR